MTANPPLIEAVRGGRTESRHRGAFALADADGRLLAASGDVETPVFPRSSYKLFQAVPLVETGAAEAFDLGDAELSLACASHSGEARHVDTVRTWLRRLDLSEDALECGVHRPRHEASADALIRAGEAFGQAHNNCSGKHTGFLSIARHLGAPAEGYTKPDHEVQRLVTETICALSGFDAARAGIAIDGCSAPALAMPLAALATGMARCADPSGLPGGRAAAAGRLTAAIAAEPFMIAGTERCCTTLIEESGRRALVKVGAEGVYAGLVPERGLGIALKIDDGGTRAAEVAMAAILVRLGLIDPEAPRVRAFHRPVIRNWRGLETGILKETGTAFQIGV
ncbi:MAG: asparaginase [Alphaproteobacteria bacterium]